MVKLKLNKESLAVITLFSEQTCRYIEVDIEKFIGKKRTIDFIQFRIQLAEMKILLRKLRILELNKTHLNSNKVFSFTLSPIQCLLFVIHLETFKKHTKNDFTINVLNQIKDFIYHEMKY